MTDELAFKDNGWANQVDTRLPPCVDVIRVGDKVIAIEIYFDSLPVNGRRWRIKPLTISHGIEVRPISDNRIEIGDTLKILRNGMKIEETLYREHKQVSYKETTEPSLEGELKQEIYHSSTLGPIPLSFTGRRLLANLREAATSYTQQYWGTGKTPDYRSVSIARGAIAKYISDLEEFKTKSLVRDRLPKPAPNLVWCSNTELLAELISRVKKNLISMKDVLCSLGSAL